jgi:tetratricopeptide (TPR) repeat protein
MGDRIRASYPQTFHPMNLRRKPFVVAALFVLIVALVVRFIFLSQAKQAPDFDLLFSDQHSYDAWAQQIAAGDWLSRAQGIFFQSPLYPYFLAVNFKLFGHDLNWVRVLQITLGSASCVFLYDATRRLFGNAAGVIAGLLLALYPSAILFDTQIDKAPLDTLFLSVLIWLLARMQLGRDGVRPRPAWWLLLGAVLGTWCLNRENALLLLPVIAIWTWFVFSALSRRQRVLRIAVFLGLALGVLCISGFRNLFVGGEFHFTTAQFGPNFWLGNGAGADGVYRPVLRTHADPTFERADFVWLAQKETGRQLSAGEVSSFFVHKTIDDIAADPMRWVALMGRKCLLVFNRAEIADSADLDYYVAWSGVLRWLDYVLTFPVLLALFAASVPLLWDERRRLALLYAMFGAFALSAAAFYVFSRYRYPLVLMMAPVVAGGIVNIFAALRQKRWGRLCAAVACAALALCISLPAAVLPARIRGVDYYNRAVAYQSRGNDAAAIANYRKSVRANPDVAQTRSNFGLALAKQGDFQSALAECDAAIRLEPTREIFYNNRATVLIQMKELERADADFKKALELNPHYLSVWFNLGMLEKERGHLDRAIDAFRELVRRQADYPDAHFQLGQLLQLKDQDREAADQFREALKFQPDALQAADALAMLLATSDDPKVKNVPEAQRVAEIANEAAHGQSAALLDTLSVTYAAQGRFDDALRIATRARAIAKATGQTTLHDQINQRLAAFAEHRLK